MKKLAVSLIGLSLAGCAAETTRTLPVLVWEDKPLVYQERAPIVLPPDYRNPTLHQPKEDTVLLDYKKNNFIGTAPLPPPRPSDLSKPKDMQATPVPPRKPCSIDSKPGCVK